MCGKQSGKLATHLFANLVAAERRLDLCGSSSDPAALAASTTDIAQVCEHTLLEG